jgi:hypothetical protein
VAVTVAFEPLDVAEEAAPVVVAEESAELSSPALSPPVELPEELSSSSSVSSAADPEDEA